MPQQRRFASLYHVPFALDSDQNETRDLSDINAGDALGALIPIQHWGVYLDGSIHGRVPGVSVYATVDQLVDETAARGGTVSFSVDDPAIWGSTVDVVQEWCASPHPTRVRGKRAGCAAPSGPGPKLGCPI